jgi:hypothetical protein
LPDLQSFIDRLNSHNASTSIQYRINPTNKYLCIKCVNCNFYSVWYRNKEAIDIEHFAIKSKLGKVEGIIDKAVINVQWYRGISKCHDMKKHEDIVFEDSEAKE